MSQTSFNSLCIAFSLFICTLPFISSIFCRVASSIFASMSPRDPSICSTQAQQNTVMVGRPDHHYGRARPYPLAGTVPCTCQSHHTYLKRLVVETSLDDQSASQLDGRGQIAGRWVEWSSRWTSGAVLLVTTQAVDCYITMVLCYMVSNSIKVLLTIDCYCIQPTNEGPRNKRMEHFSHNTTMVLWFQPQWQNWLW